jgi:hypothetical protein
MSTLYGTAMSEISWGTLQLRPLVLHDRELDGVGVFEHGEGDCFPTQRTPRWVGTRRELCELMIAHAIAGGSSRSGGPSGAEEPHWVPLTLRWRQRGMFRLKGLVNL